MTAKKVLIISTLVGLVALLVIVVRGNGSTTTAPQPALSTAADNQDATGAVATSGTIKLPSDPEYVIWAYNSSQNAFLGYLPEDNELAYISTSATIRPITTISDGTVIGVAISPDGTKMVVHLLRDSGNQELLYVAITDSGTTTSVLPYAAQSVDWLADGQLVYLYHNQSTVSVSRATDATFSKWQLITGLSLQYSDATVTVSPDGQYVLVTSMSSQTTAVVNVSDKTIKTIDGQTSSAQWADSGHTAILQETGVTDSFVVYDALTQQSRRVTNSHAPYIAIIHNGLLIGITPNFQDDTNANLDTVVVDLTSGSATVGTTGIVNTTVPSVILTDAKHQQLFIGTGSLLDGISYDALVNKVMPR